LLAAATLAAGCHQYLDPRLYGQARHYLPDASPEAVLQVRALGVHGFVVRVGELAVVTPPLYSNPDLDKVVDGNVPLLQRDDLVDRYLEPDWVKGVVAIVVGHSHYDHLMDLPYIHRKLLPNATLYGSQTAAYIVEKLDVPANKVMAVNGEDDAVDYRQCPEKPKEGCIFKKEKPAGKWLFPPEGQERIRIRALCSRHSSQFLRLPVKSTGCYSAPLTEIPRTSNEWKLGDTFAYLIDFLDRDGAVAFRVYFQDSPTEPGFGYVHEDLIREHAVDVAILCAGAWDQVHNNPGGIVANTKPRYVLFGHWDNFFRPPDKELQTLGSVDLRKLSRDMERLMPLGGQPAARQRYWFAPPGALFVFPRRT
jgi:L-ascorbate metabolism protein UlaG (beta-lactamase superfamily)